MRREAVCIGVDVTADSSYGRRLRALQASASDAQALAAAAEERQYASTLLVDAGATLANAAAAIADAAKRLERDDTFLLAFSGHGVAGETPFGFQQSWCLYDAAFARFGGVGLDAHLARFEAGVRICILMNCCHSGRNWDPKPPTPPIRAHVVRFAACGSSAVAYDAPHPGRLSPFVEGVVALMQLPSDGGILGFYDRLAARTPIRPELEINHPRSEDFLREGF